VHPSVLAWVESTLTAEDVAARRILEVGSCDVNGSVRPYLESLGPAEYLGVDAGPGPRVDRVVDCEELAAAVGVGDWDIVVSTEMLEHVRDWRECLIQLAMTVAPGGKLLITTRSPGFPYHPFPEDHWRYTRDFMCDVMATLDMGATVVDDPDPYSPGVFVFAEKPSVSVAAGWRPFTDELYGYEPEPVRR
jgi:SAM-dependent methyltransferase